MAHYDIFREQLAIKYPAYGHALWEPSPGRLYSPVEVGDVGYVREGKFHRLFNALLAADHPSHRTFGVPEYHVPLIPNPSEHIDNGTLKPSHHCSHGITVTTAETDFHAKPDDLPQVSYLCTRRQQGAVSFIPVSAQRQDTIARGDFGRWIIKHIELWLAFTRRLGLGIEQMEDIILVTGFHRTRSWANAAFLESHTDAQVSFGVEVTGADGPGMGIRWQYSPERVRGAVLTWGPDGKDLPEDQCIFIRGFRVTRTLRILPKHLIAAAEPSSDPDQNDHEPDMELISTPAITEYRDPLHLLLEHIANRAPDCNMVLVHDDDLARMAGICDSDEPFQTDTAPCLHHQSQPEIQQVQCDSLCVGESSSTTTAEATTVAMSSAEFREWAEPCISRNVEGHREVWDPLLQPPTLQPELPPSDPSSECAESALQGRLAEHPGAPSGCAQPHADEASAPQQGPGKTGGSEEVRSRKRRLSGLLRSLRGTRVSGNEVGSRITSREDVVETTVGAADTVALSHHLATSSVGPTAPPSSVERIALPTFMTSDQIDVLSWTSQDPRQSLLFNSWGVLYRFHTDSDPQGQSTTTVWRAKRAKRANTEDRVAKLEWAPSGGLGHAVFGKNKVPITDLVQPDPRIPNSRVFVAPDGLQYMWRPSTTNQDIMLEDPNSDVIAFIRPIRPTSYTGLGDVHAELHFLHSAGTGVVIDFPLMDTITMTAMLYRFVTAYNL